MGCEKLAQFKLKLDTRKRLRDFKTDNYDNIIRHFSKDRDFVSYDDVINYLLNEVKNQ